jgi:hypothetical protein
MPGATSVASHVIEERAGGSLVTLRIEQTGVLFRLMPWVEAMSRCYVAMEAAGLKRNCEEDPVSSRATAAEQQAP